MEVFVDGAISKMWSIQLVMFVKLGSRIWYIFNRSEHCICMDAHKLLLLRLYSPQVFDTVIIFFNDTKKWKYVFFL